MSRQTRTSYRSSELSRSSAEVFAAADDHPITVTRRDGEPLVMMSEREDSARKKLLNLAAQLIGAATVADGSLHDYMSNQFPWILALSLKDQHECARDILNSARASFSTGQPYLALATLTSWRETAEAVAAGLVDASVEWIDDQPVERP